jgi:hypothetical protein
MFAKIENGSVAQYPYTLEQMHSDNPDTSFPNNIPQHLRESFGVFDVGYEGAPAFDPTTHRVVTSDLPSLIDGKWMLTKTIEPQTSEQIAINTANKAAQIRSERNNKLSASDWTQVADAPVDQAAWAAYRQALRDVTAQAGFPWSVEWPTQP